ncbi:MAG: hypothetical protein NTY64_22335, partial [Deltaproteobacteria bacterium]|nr:hypothetical protein [Deltaproteobacteria bacterium]
GVLPSTPHSLGIVRLASGAFYFAIHSNGFLRDHQLCISQWPSRSFMLAQGFILLIQYPTRKKPRPVIYNLLYHSSNSPAMLVHLRFGARCPPDSCAAETMIVWDAPRRGKCTTSGLLLRRIHI